MEFHSIEDEASLMTEEVWEHLIARLRKTRPSRWIPPVPVAVDPALSEEILPKGTELTPGRWLAVDLPITIERE